MTTRELLAEALRFHQGGQLAEAENRYRKILTQDPRQPDADSRS